MYIRKEANVYVNFTYIDLKLIRRLALCCLENNDKDIIIFISFFFTCIWTCSLLNMVLVTKILFLPIKKIYIIYNTIKWIRRLFYAVAIPILIRTLPRDRWSDCFFSMVMRLLIGLPFDLHMIQVNKSII